ncbi:GerAB/ArcD/ProY family transporter [Wansuia hejianensis]|uniref:Endospore germination permease n=1 Tax=Wansuia hejianensis TaxID=2763667 RepID=A0A926F2Z7_9FIRM|nr:endospore germination permease [Wansuia hejianensis]MBC8591037.1 endospore germination permease [Wansuia hejianensis]
MRKEEISTSQAYWLIVIFIMGTSSVMTGYTKALQDTWICLLLALIYATPMVIIYGSVMNRYPGMDLFQILEFVFGKFVGKIIGFLYFFYFLHTGSIAIREITEYIQVVSFPETPQYFTGLFLGLLTIYILKSGIEVIVRVNKFILPVFIFIISITLVIGIPKMEFSNFLPILYNGWKPVFKGSLAPFTFSFGETVIFMTILNTVNESKKANRIYLTGTYIGCIILLSAILRNIAILGFPNLVMSNFSSYYASTLIDIGNYIRGIELAVSIVLVVAGFLKITVYLLGASIGFSRIFKFGDYKWVSGPLGLLMLSLSFILYDSTMDMFEWLDIYKYYSLPFQVFIPILVFIVGIFKKKKVKSQE